MAKARGGPAKKAPGTAMKPSNGVRIVLKEPGERYDPSPHIDHPVALAMWEQFWDDPVSSLVNTTDKPVLARWIDLTQRYWRIVDALEGDELTQDSVQGNRVSHPLLSTLTVIENAIERLEAKFGMGPKNRAALGIAIVKLDRDNERRPPSNAPAPVDEPDPRIMG